MRILWLQQYFGTPQGWGSQRQYAFARQWVQAGHAVDVVCSSAYDASLAGAAGAVDGIRLHVSRAAYRPQMGFARRCLAFLRFMCDALWHVTRHGRDYDVLVASSGPLTNLIPALWGRILYRLPFVFEVLDVWPDAAVEAGVLREGLLVWLCRRLESAGYRCAARIVTCSTGMTARVYAKLQGARERDLSVSGPYRACLAAAGRVDRRLATIPHGGDLDQPERAACRRRLLQEQGWPEDVCVVLYMGAMGLSNAIDDVVEAVRLTAEEPGLVWVFAGSGAYEGRVREGLAHARGAFIGKVAHARMRELCAAADVNVVTFRHEPLFFENSPNKFFDGIAAGLPAVFNRSTWLEPWLRLYECGVACAGVEPGRELADAVRALAADPERRRQMGRNARRLAEEVFGREKLAAEYLAVLEEVLKCGSSKVLKGGIMKRAFDITLVMLAAGLWLPLLLVAALAVRVGLGRPVFFIQERPGLRGRPFRLIKFRSMREGDGCDAERLTRLGRWLRATSLDELPELLNVLRGEMSLVGPRPLLMRYLDRYTPEQARRHEVRPGLTGWAQVNGRNAISWERKFEYDVWYVDHRSLWLDLKILWLTVWQVLSRRGVSAEDEATMGEFGGSSERGRS